MGDGITAAAAWEVFRRAELLHTAEEVDDALRRMAAGVTQTLAGTDPIVVCVMSGGVVPYGKLLPLLSFPLRTDYLHATRYGKRLQGGQLQWIAGPHLDPRGSTILLVDDILDEGLTLAGIETRYRAEGAIAVYKAVLFVKQRPRAVPITADFQGLTVPNRYVFGSGMDYKGYLRNAPGVWAECT